MATAAKPPQIVEIPSDGAYLTDGVRLAQVSGLDVKGQFILSDCGSNCDQEAALLVVPPHELMERWMTVEEFARRKRAAVRQASPG